MPTLQELAAAHLPQRYENFPRGRFVTLVLVRKTDVFVNPEWPTLMLGSGPPSLSFRPPRLTVGQVVA